jgi:hypothetical protein
MYEEREKGLQPGFGGSQRWTHRHEIIIYRPPLPPSLPLMCRLCVPFELVVSALPSYEGGELKVGEGGGGSNSIA